MNEPQMKRTDRIAELHREIIGYLKVTVDKAIEIGGLLIEQKAELDHGQWLPWVRENLPFSERLARDYMRFYDRRDELKTANVADLTEARRLLSKPDHDELRKQFDAAMAEIKSRIPVETDISALQAVAENMREIGTMAFEKSIALEAQKRSFESDVPEQAYFENLDTAYRLISQVPKTLTEDGHLYMKEMARSILELIKGLGVAV